jgi:hypothetical protein
MEKAQFTAPFPMLDSGANAPLINITASLTGDRIAITETIIINRDSTSQTYQAQLLPDGQFMVPADTDQPTRNMIIGAAQRLVTLKNAPAAAKI